MANEQRDYLNLCSFRELFRGRFTDDEASFLLLRFQGDVQETINFVLHKEPAEVRQAISEEQDGWNVVGKISRLKQTQRDVLERARAGRIDTSACMFACQSCDHFWWRRAPDRKKVSRCDRCHKRYDALPRERAWGWAEFKCQNCQHEFRGYCAMWAKSPCYQCGEDVSPTRILSPTTGDRGRRGTHSHQCSAPDCIGTYGQPRPREPGRRPHYILRGDDGQLLPLTCVHPLSRRHHGRSIVVVSSHQHDSTGSTVDTFLPQGDLTAAYEPVPLPTVPEELSDD